jgi:hypothetical protein
MVAKLVFLVGVLGVGGYAYNKASNYDPAVVPYSKEQAQAALAEATTTMPRRTGDGTIRIWGAGRSTKGVTLNMKYASWAPLLTCEAVITEVSPNESRVVPDCSDGEESDSAIANTEDQLQVPMFEEHIQSTLHKRPFNRDTVTQKEIAVVMGNMGGMQKEALKSHDEAQRMLSEASH